MAALFALGIFLALTLGGSTGSLPGFSLPTTPTVAAAVPDAPHTPTGFLTSTGGAQATSGPAPVTQGSGTRIYLPIVGGVPGVVVVEVARPTPQPTPVATPPPTETPPPLETSAPTATTVPPVAPVPPVTPVPPVATVPPATSVPVQVNRTPPVAPVPGSPRGPIRTTKLGLGVYTSGGGMLPALDEARPSVILLMDPSEGFARDVRQRFPRAFIVGRIFAADQPLDNPAQRGTAFADRVAGSAVPLKGVVDAWMSYNEVAAASDPQGMTNYGIFQGAFAHRLQDHYGIPAVAGNDGPRAIPAELYSQYFGEAIRVSKFFGFHLYPDIRFTSLRDPAAAHDVFYYRQIHDALVAAGIQPGPFIATEAGLYNGWRGVEDDTEMGKDFVWLADQMNNDSYLIGMTVFGLFQNGKWQNFEIFSSNILQTIGDYNTAH